MYWFTPSMPHVHYHLRYLPGFPHLLRGLLPLGSSALWNASSSVPSMIIASSPTCVGTEQPSSLGNQPPRRHPSCGGAQTTVETWFLVPANLVFSGFRRCGSSGLRWFPGRVPLYRFGVLLLLLLLQLSRGRCCLRAAWGRRWYVHVCRSQAVQEVTWL